MPSWLSCSKDRKQALKTLWAAPFVATGTGEIDIETAGQRYEVRVTFDRIAQEPRISLECLGDSDVKNGTRIALHWRGIAVLEERDTLSFYNLMGAFAAFNPHATILTDRHAFLPTAPDWAHWRPDRRTSPHWYTGDHLCNLIALLLDADRQADDRSRSINEFVRQSSGISSTGKSARVTKTAGLHGTMLSDLINGNDIDSGKVAALLEAMQQEAKPVRNLEKIT